jgi:hypothetical protein
MIGQPMKLDGFGVRESVRKELSDAMLISLRCLVAWHRRSTCDRLGASVAITACGRLLNIKFL